MNKINVPRNYVTGELGDEAALVKAQDTLSAVSPVAFYKVGSKTFWHGLIGTPALVDYIPKPANPLEGKAEGPGKRHAPWRAAGLPGPIRNIRHPWFKHRNNFQYLKLKVGEDYDTQRTQPRHEWPVHAKLRPVASGRAVAGFSKSDTAKDVCPGARACLLL